MKAASAICFIACRQEGASFSSGDPWRVPTEFHRIVGCECQSAPCRDTKHVLLRMTQTKCDPLNRFKVQSESSKIRNLEKNFDFHKEFACGNVK